jgi:hypothetical protein
MMEEPSVLDYLKSKLNPFKREKIQLEEAQPKESETKEPRPVLHVPWRILAAVLLALIAQAALEPPYRSAIIAIVFYVLSGGVLIWSILCDELQLAPPREDSNEPLSMKVIPYSFILGAVLILVTFYLFGPNSDGRILFTAANTLIWLVTIIFFMVVLWVRKSRVERPPLKARLSAFIRNPVLSFVIRPYTILLLVVIITAVFFRFYRLNEVPGEMFSDHAEKLLDVADVLRGQTSVFFERNTGREAIQMYLTAAIALICKTGLAFMSLKLGTALAGLFTLPYIYLLGKEMGNRWVGLLALLLASVAYWPNLIGRIGLRFPLYPLFVAPALFYLIRGLRSQNRNDFILSGIALGLGVHGYSPFRLMPFVVVVAVLIYLIHKQSHGKRWQVFWALVVLALVSFVVFLPLFRYMLHNPDMFYLRGLSRLGTIEQPLPGPALAIFFNNLWKAWIMPFWNNGDIWVHSVVGRPALDIVTAALYFIGSVSILVRYLRKRHWLDLFILLSVPLLMMPSILSLAFPGENPSLNRTGGAIIPIFIIAAIGMEGILASLIRATNKLRWGYGIALTLGLILILWTGRNNYDLVLNKFDRQFMLGAWNTSDMGKIIADFSHSIGSPDSAYVVPFPYWVDTRLVGINAGYPLTDYAIWSDQFNQTTSDKRPKLFIVKFDDSASMDALKALYPHASYWLFRAQYPGKDFWIFTVPGESGEWAK